MSAKRRVTLATGTDRRPGRVRRGSGQRRHVRGVRGARARVVPIVVALVMAMLSSVIAELDATLSVAHFVALLSLAPVVWLLGRHKP